MCSDILEDSFDAAILKRKTKEILPFVEEYPNFDEEFTGMIPEGYDKAGFTKRIWEIFSHELGFEGTGIIIGGIDTQHHYPSLFVLNIYCNDNGNVIHQSVESYINCEKPLVKAYAISDEAYSFITGVSDDFESFIKDYVKEAHEGLLQNIEWHLINENIPQVDKITSITESELEKMKKEFNQQIDYYKTNILKDTCDSCEYLPRQLLSDLASTLIELTSLKQKISLDLETVSSEKDILLITKSDDVKWLKFTEEIV